MADTCSSLSLPREKQVQNIVNTESYGVGVRVLANGTWGFAASSDVTDAGIAKATERALAIAKANSRVQKEPVKLAPQKGYGEVSWKHPIVKNAFEVPISQKVDLLLSANARALDNGANFVNSALFQVNEQKYFASTDGSYIDQDVHRIWPTFSVTAIDKTSGKFRTRQALSAPCRSGLRIPGWKPADKVKGPLGTGIFGYRDSYDMLEDATAAPSRPRKS
jgi:TldD protein